MESAKQSSQPPKWDWIPCNYNLKTEVKKKVVVWNLQPSIVLTSPNDNGQDPAVKLYIDTEKSLQYSDELGWNWHKSWNLPNISVRLEIKDDNSGENLLAPKNLYAHIFAVKAVIDQPDNFHLVDVGIRGTNKLELVNGQAFFTAIKFFSTSYNNEGVKFHLVLCIYIQNEDDSPKILNATISPPIFVDSRKSARDPQEVIAKKMTSFVEPFSPDNLDKPFIKRENKRKNDAQIQIINNVEGLYNYLTAPNIRHKVKHPLFLSLKFSACVKLFFNTQFYINQKKEQILEQLQNRLTKEHCQKNNVQVNMKFEERYFILFVEDNSDSYKNRKVVEAIESLQCPSLGIIYQLNLLPNIFENICTNELEGVNEMISLYKKNYPNLVAAAKQIRQSNLENYDEEEDEDYDSQSEDQDSDSFANEQMTSSKKVKPNPPISQEKNLEAMALQQQQYYQQKMQLGKDPMSNAGMQNGNLVKLTEDGQQYPLDNNQLIMQQHQQQVQIQMASTGQQQPSGQVQINKPVNQSELGLGQSGSQQPPGNQLQGQQISQSPAMTQQTSQLGAQAGQNPSQSMQQQGQTGQGGAQASPKQLQASSQQHAQSSQVPQMQPNLQQLQQQAQPLQSQPQNQLQQPQPQMSQQNQHLTQQFNQQHAAQQGHGTTPPPLSQQHSQSSEHSTHKEMQFQQPEGQKMQSAAQAQQHQTPYNPPQPNHMNMAQHELESRQHTQNQLQMQSLHQQQQQIKVYPQEIEKPENAMEGAYMKSQAQSDIALKKDNMIKKQEAQYNAPENFANLSHKLGAGYSQAMPEQVHTPTTSQQMSGYQVPFYQQGQNQLSYQQQMMQQYGQNQAPPSQGQLPQTQYPQPMQGQIPMIKVMPGDKMEEASHLQQQQHLLQVMGNQTNIDPLKQNPLMKNQYMMGYYPQMPSPYVQNQPRMINQSNYPFYPQQQYPNYYNQLNQYPYNNMMQGSGIQPNLPQTQPQAPINPSMAAMGQQASGLTPQQQYLAQQQYYQYQQQQLQHQQSALQYNPNKQN